MLKIIICGILGNMGFRMLAACYADNGIEIVAGVDQRSGKLDNIPLFSSFDDCTVKGDVVVDFSNPALTDSILAFCARTKTALVLCTTGQTEEQMEKVRELAQKVAVFKSANMSLGVALLTSLAKKAAVLLGDSFDIEIVEKHHNKKVDAPSGTALMLADAINSVRGSEYDYTYDRHEERRQRRKNEIGIHAVRGGTIVGEHEVIFAGNDEVITLAHSAASKSLFATGAVKAAHFIVKQPAGLYNMDSMVQGL